MKWLIAGLEAAGFLAFGGLVYVTALAFGAPKDAAYLLAATVVTYIVLYKR